MPTVKDSASPREDWKYRLEWGNFIVGALTFLAVVGYGLVAYKQWGEMIRAASEAKRSADASQGQLNLLSQERRAWATATILGEYAFAANKEARITIFVRNFGRMPARTATKYTIAVFPWPSGELPKTLHTDPTSSSFPVTVRSCMGTWQSDQM